MHINDLIFIKNLKTIIFFYIHKDFLKHLIYIDLGFGENITIALLAAPCSYLLISEKLIRTKLVSSWIEDNFFYQMAIN